MRHTICCVLILGILFFLRSGSTRADEVLQYVPDQALGYVVARDLEKSSEIVERLAEPLGYSIPSPLNLVRLSLGLGPGIDNSGTLAIAFLPGSEIQPMVLLPVSDYAAFAQSVQADPSGEVCRIALAGEDVLAARLGDYAILVNLDNQSALQRLLDRQTDPELDRQTDPASRRFPSGDWTSKQNAYVTLMPAGLKYLARQKPAQPRRFITPVEEFQEPSLLPSITATLFGPEQRSWLATNTKLVALGVSVDESLNVRGSLQVDLNRRSPLARLAPTPSERQPAVTSLGNVRFAFAAGIAVPEGWGEMLADLLLQTEKGSASATGLENLPAELWAKQATANRLLLQEIVSCSLVLLPGQEGDPLMGNFLAIAEVPKVDDYLDSLSQVVETWNEINDRSTSDIKPVSEIAERNIRGQRLTEIVVDYATTFAEDNVPVTKWMLEAAFGSDGKLRMKFLAVDQTHFLFGLATDEQMSRALQALRDDKNAETTTSEATIKLLDPQALCQVLLQPQAALDWVARVENEFLGLLMINAQEATYPKVPDCPPLGLSMSFADERWHFDVACPATAWTTLGKYLTNYDDLE